MTAPPRTPLLSETTCAQMRLDIIYGVLAPGAQFTEGELEARYATGKATVRAAIARLSQERLLATAPRRGVIISAVTMRDVVDVFEARAIVEPPIARRAAEAMTGRLLEDLEHAAGQLRKPEVRKSLPALLGLLRDFQLAVAEGLGNPKLTRALAVLVDDTERILHLALAQSDFRAELIKVPAKMMAAFRTSSPAQVERLSRELLIKVKELTIAALVTSRSIDLAPAARRTRPADTGPR
jgi:DNA-binding GntR family transcriptional regulator